jgi:P27 family predicted phage terminase small subunit
MAKTRPPAHLSKTAKAWFSAVAASYDLDETHIQILTMAAELRDRAENARQLVQEDGAILADRFGQQREHPAAKLERDSKIAFARMMRELGLAHDDSDDSRPPRPGVTSCREK